MVETEPGPHLFQDLLQVSVSFLRRQLQLHHEPIDLINDQNRPDVLQPRLTQHNLGLTHTHTPVFESSW